MTDEQPEQTETETPEPLEQAAENEALSAEPETQAPEPEPEAESQPEPEVTEPEPEPIEPETTEPELTEPQTEVIEAGIDTGTTVIDEPAAKPRRELGRALRGKLVPIVLVVLLVITGSVTAWLYFKQYAPDQQTNASAARVAVDAASDGTVALLSYSADTLDKDFAAARSHLTGDFRSYYDKFAAQTVAPAAKQKSLKTTAHVVRAAVSDLQPDSAVVLVFVDQTTTSKDSPEPTVAASSVLVRMTRINDKWLINKFDPV